MLCFFVHMLPLAPPSSLPASTRSGRPQLGWLDWLTEDEPQSEEATAAFAALCRADGWAVRCELGADVARSLGGSGALARGGDESSPTAQLDLTLRFALDEGYLPPQGGVQLLSRSRWITAEPRGFWKVDADEVGGVPTYLQWRLSCPEGLEASGQQVLPPGPLYFNARSSLSSGADGLPRLRLSDGRLTVKEELGANTPLFSAKGILAEFKIVGQFSCREASPKSRAVGEEAVE